jgi:hypothetical protein
MQEGDDGVILLPIPGRRLDVILQLYLVIYFQMRISMPCGCALSSTSQSRTPLSLMAALDTPRTANEKQ